MNVQSSSTPAWQTERAKVLQRACQSIRAAIQRGEPIGRHIRKTARRLNGRPFRSDSSRRLALSYPTLRRLWDQWRRGGEVPAAFRLNWKTPTARIIPAPLLVRFAEYCASTPHRSLAAAWRSFARGSGRLGLGASGRALKISDWSLRQHFPAAQFHLMQSRLKAITAAQTELQKDKFKAIAEIRRRLPDRLPRRPCIKRNPSFEI